MMKKWFKLANEWYEEKDLLWDPKGNWQKFVNELKKVWNIQSEKIPWFKLDYQETRKKLLPKKVEWESNFEIKEHVIKEK